MYNRLLHIATLSCSILLCLCVFVGCRTIQDLRNFARCQFRIQNVSNISLAGINLDNLKNPSDINVVDGARIAGALASGNLPLALQLNIDARNPNNDRAAMQRMDWIAALKGTQIAEGALNDRIEIPPNNGVASFPLPVQSNLNEIFKGKNQREILGMSFDIADSERKPKDLSLRVRPSINIGGVNLRYPGYIDVGKNF
ncbi:MAG: hypothetical protein JJT94_15880 [Bernardetiaceae bacterium]|nr:hypothetical protein [Bernardetiaceae bacterium]